MNELLHKINLILQEDKLLKQEKRKRGEHFNIFEIMNAQTDEVDTHSAILATLLNPKEKHGCKSVFLSLFVKKFLEVHKYSQPIEFDMDFEKCSVHKEFDTGNGRLDILIKSEKKAIIIENKINADDQDKQLLRYKNYAENKFGAGNYLFLYLTLDGREPSNVSTAGEMCVDQDFFCISYGTFILEWLSECKEKATSNPIVRETITQYYNLIAKLTHKNMETSTNEKLVKLLANKENIAAMFKMSDVKIDVLNKILNTTLVEQIKEIAQELKLELDIKSSIEWNKKYSGHFFFSKPDWKYFSIGFEFMKDDFKDFYFGIRYKSESDRGKEQDTFNLINEKLGGDSSNWWASLKPFEYRDWNNETTFNRLYEGKIKEEIKNNVYELLEKLEGVQL